MAAAEGVVYLDKVRRAIEGRRAGAAVISYVIVRGPTTLKQVPPLNFVVR